jgi:hypothetical protein
MLSKSSVADLTESLARELGGLPAVPTAEQQATSAGGAGGAAPGAAPANAPANTGSMDQLHANANANSTSPSAQSLINAKPMAQVCKIEII